MIWFARNKFASLALLTLAFNGCMAIPFLKNQPPSVRAIQHDKDYPAGLISFVEKGHRSKGKLVLATAGFDNPYRADWSHVLLPVPPTGVAGPQWTGEEITGEEAVKIHKLPDFRDAQDLQNWADLTRIRFETKSVWILSTDPLVVGIPDGDPLRSWRDFAATLIGRQRAALTMALGGVHRPVCRR